MCSSFSFHRSCQELLQGRLPTGSQHPLGIHLLQCWVLPGLEVDLCSPRDLPGLPHHGLQGNSSAWCISCLPFLTALSAAELLLSYIVTPLCDCCYAAFPPFLKYITPEVPPPFLRISTSPASIACMRQGWSFSSFS